MMLIFQVRKKAWSSLSASLWRWASATFWSAEVEENKWGLLQPKFYCYVSEYPYILKQACHVHVTERASVYCPAQPPSQHNSCEPYSAAGQPRSIKKKKCLVMEYFCVSHWQETRIALHLPAIRNSAPHLTIIQCHGNNLAQPHSTCSPCSPCMFWCSSSPILMHIHKHSNQGLPTFFQLNIL